MTGGPVLGNDSPHTSDSHRAAALRRGAVRQQQTSRRAHALGGAWLGLLTAAVLLTGCTGASPTPTPNGVATPGSDATGSTPNTTPSDPAPSAADATQTPTPAPVSALVEPTGESGVVTGGLAAPWSILRLTAQGIGLGTGTPRAMSSGDGTAIAEGTTLISQRDDGSIRELLADGSTREVAVVAGVASGGEAGLLGLAARAVAAASATETGTNGSRQPTASGVWIYAYFTSEADNRIVRMPVLGGTGALALGPAEVVFSGIPRAGNHDGGRIAFGPDGMLYATAGDAGDVANAQNANALGGKILRMTPNGHVPPGNPFGNVVWSIGHRNPQGIAWDSHGRLWASEFGQNTWDELNHIVAGNNYGWPIVEGAAGDGRFVDPIQQWPTSEASPSGLAIIADTIFMASLRGERVWRWAPDAGQPPSPWFVGEFGRIRDVAAGPDGTLWILTNNTDGRGDPGANDDRLLQLGLKATAGS